ncbi:MAG: F0F1 ATP synthase subunit beta, partial [Candidatus Wildermuthbacteria bacterium]|nr:F0F1 ATP synthase subunit beta [Candidatus Wildermuthbacteria bacterium]
MAKITQVIGPVVDVEFFTQSGEEKLPSLYGALKVESKNLILEIEQYLGEQKVRCLAMGPTEGLKRGDDVADLGGPITIPVGKEVCGRV